MNIYKIDNSWFYFFFNSSIFALYYISCMFSSALLIYSSLFNMYMPKNDDTLAVSEILQCIIPGGLWKHICQSSRRVENLHDHR